MTHPAYPPIINLTGFRKCERPQDVCQFIDMKHPAAKILHAICRTPWHPYSLADFVNMCGFCTGHVNARVEFWILRINDTLPRTGWRIRDDYRIERISLEHENRLILRLGMAA